MLKKIILAKLNIALNALIICAIISMFLSFFGLNFWYLILGNCAGIILVSTYFTIKDYRKTKKR